MSYRDEHHIKIDNRVFVFLQDAIVNREVIAINYYSPYKDQFTQRDVEPLGLLIRGNYWYLAGWCRMRTGYRMFHIDRIEHYKKTGNQLSDPSEHTLQAFSKQSLGDEKDPEEVIVQFDQGMIRYMGDQKYNWGWVSKEQTDDGVAMTFLTSSVEYFARWLPTWGHGAEVVGPESLKDRVRELSEELWRHHRE